MVNFRRNKLPGCMYFFTVTLRDRKSDILTKHFHVLRDAMKCIQKNYPFKTKAIVVLPDHIHAIWQLPPGDNNYSYRWQHIKGLFTSKIISKNFNFIKDKRGEYNLWQRRFWEHTIRDENDLEQHINYIHYNPIKHNLVKKLENWPFSSFHYFVSKEWLSKDWSSGSEVVDDSKFGE